MNTTTNQNEYIGKTHEQVLNEIANKSEITSFDEKFILYWALQSGFKNAVVTCGVIYPLGQGQPFSCNSFAKMLLQEVKKEVTQ